MGVSLAHEGIKATMDESVTIKCAFLLEDHDSFRRALAHLLEREPDIEVVGQAGSLQEARDFALGRLDQIDVATVDLLLPDGIGTDFIREVHRARPELPVLVVTLVREKEVHDWARAMGATEVMTKDVAPEEIVAAVRRLALAGGG
jgi:DNA-binding NarL/FixJ family response regulator